MQVFRYDVTGRVTQRGAFIGNIMKIMNKYAVWYSLHSDYELIQSYFNKEKGFSKFEKDFYLKNRFIDYDHVVSIWYGKEYGELGDLFDNPELESAFYFITKPVAERLMILGIDKVSYVFAIPDFEYKENNSNCDVLKFLDNITCSQQSSSWLDEILNDL